MTTKLTKPEKKVVSKVLNERGASLREIGKLLGQKLKLKELFDSMLHKSFSNQ